MDKYKWKKKVPDIQSKEKKKRVPLRIKHKVLTKDSEPCRLYFPAFGRLLRSRIALLTGVDKGEGNLSHHANSSAPSIPYEKSRTTIFWSCEVLTRAGQPCLPQRGPVPKVNLT